MPLDWSRLKGASPINRLSGLALGPREAEFDIERKVRSWDIRSLAPLPMKAVQEGKENLTGAVYGRLTVVGLYDSMAHRGLKTRQGARWVVRCVCGYYEVRRSGVLHDPEYVKRARCSGCDRTAEVVSGRSPDVPIRHERVEETAKPKSPRQAWEKGAPPPPLMRLYLAVVRSKDDVTFSELAKMADIPREQVRPLLAAMVDHGILRERGDGWYIRGIIRSRAADSA